MANELISLQTVPEAPVTRGAEAKTNMVLASKGTAERMRHFPEEVYDLSAESHLSRFLKVLLGDAGAGQVRKRMFLSRLQSTLQGSHFYDLDKFYGPLFNLRRTADEILDFDPRTSTGTTEEWDEAIARDASFRSRIEQFAKALSYGPTPTGMELIAEALLSVDCEVYESFIQADSSYQTIAELEAQYGEGSAGSIDNMEGQSISTLEGAQLNRLSGDERRVFTIRPKRRISQREAYDLRRVINRVKPADARLIIDFEGVPLHDPIKIDSVSADSEHWEIVSEIATEVSVLSPYLNQSSEPVEQPRPPFSGYQGEAWSYNADMVGVSAYTEDFGTDRQVLPAHRVTYADGSTRDFPADQAVLPRRAVQSGRVVSDGILVVHPYSGVRNIAPLFNDAHILPDTSGATSLYADGVPVDALVRTLQREEGLDPFQQNPEHRYWVSSDRTVLDPDDEVLEIRLSADRLVNYVTLEASHFPHNMVIEVYTDDAEWVEVYRHTIKDSAPRIIASDLEPHQRQGHPHHTGPNHWIKVGTRTERMIASRVRIRVNREVDEAVAPVVRVRDAVGNPTVQESSYTLALRSFDIGYRVTSREDFNFEGATEGGVISSTRDIAGSLVQFRPHELLAKNLLTEGGFWRSEPQPVNYAVVNLYVDTRGPGNGDGQVVDRWYLDPTHPGPHFTIYYSNDPQVTDGTDAFYEERSWTPIARDYTLQKGYVHIPQTRARYWKFEFTNLSVESYESFIPIARKVRLFPRALVEAMHRNYERTATEVPSDVLANIDVVRESRYADALNALGVTGREGLRTAEYAATEALYFPDLRRQQNLSDQSWVFGFTPWQQGDRAPRFSITGRHVYERAEVRHTSKVAFFVGLRSIQAFRTSWEQDDDTQVYYDTFEDFRNLEPGFTWNFDPGYLRTGTVPANVEVTSRTFSSLHDVSAVQFATVQSPPTQLVPDHDFRDPSLASEEWTNPDRHRRVGDAQLIYSPFDHSVLNVRHVVPLPKAVTENPGAVQAVHHPVFSYREYEVADEAAAAATEGGLETPLVGLSGEGRAYVAVRFTALTTLNSPLYLQLVNNADDSVLVEKAIVAQKGQTVEDYAALDIPEANLAVRARLVQRGKSDDAWKVSSLAVFDDGIVWEFSVNGGSDWFPAQSIRNNDNAVLTFPDPGNQLRYRARATRADQWISAIKIRPWYIGTKNARTTGNHRGPNVSVYDADVPIHEDPLFTSWRKPIPPWWFQASRKFPLLPVEGAPNVTEFSRFYGRPVTDSVTTPTDSISVKIFRYRQVEERMDFFNPISDAAVRIFYAFRSGVEANPSIADAALGEPMFGIPSPVHNTIVRPVFSRTRY